MCEIFVRPKSWWGCFGTNGLSCFVGVILGLRPIRIESTQLDWAETNTRIYLFRVSYCVCQCVLFQYTNKMLRGALSRFRSHVRGLPSPSPSSSEYFSEAEALKRFEKWCRRYDRAYSSEEEKLYRFKVFKESLEQLAREKPHDIPEYGGCFADRTSEEFKRYCNGMSSYRALMFSRVFNDASTSVRRLFKK